MNPAEAVWIETENSYSATRYVNGTPAPLVVLKTPLAKRYRGLRLIYKDLSTVKQALIALRAAASSGEHTIEKQSLSFYAIITYGKCFMASDGRGTRLNEPDAFVYADAEERKMHTTIMKMRNEYVAHSELKGFEQNIVVAALSPEAPKKVIDIYDNLMDLVDISSMVTVLESLVNALMKYVQEKYTEVFKLIEAEVNKHNIDDLYAQSIDPRTLRHDSIDVTKK